MRMRIGIAALALERMHIDRETPPPQHERSQTAGSREAYTARERVETAVPPVLQPYDFNAQLRALQGADVPGGDERSSRFSRELIWRRQPMFQPRFDVQLTPTAIEAVRMSETWRGGQNSPAAGTDGRVLYAFGAGLPVVVCAPLRVCIVEMQAGEKIVGEPQIGDSVRWNISPGMYGNGDQATQMIVLKPQETGLDTNLLITTDRRAYYLRLVSKPQDYVARVAFRYPEEENSQKWQQHLVEQRAQEREVKARCAGASGDDHGRQAELRLLLHGRERTHSTAARVRRRLQNLYPDEAGYAEPRSAGFGGDGRGWERRDDQLPGSRANLHRGSAVRSRSLGAGVG